MSNTDFSAPKTANNIDIHLLVMGLRQESTDNGLTSTFTDASEQISLIPNNFEPFNSQRCLSSFDKILSQDYNGNIDDMPPEQLQEIKESFAKTGSESFLYDGVITKAELIESGARVGNLDLQEHPEKYNLTEADYKRAEDFLQKHGIDDPDGSIVRGVAAQAERLAQKANLGLGLTTDHSDVEQSSGLEFKQPEIDNTSALTL